MPRHNDLEIPPALSGISPLLDRMQDDIIELWNSAGSQHHPVLRRMQLALPALVRIFTEHLRSVPGTPAEVRFWARVRADDDGHMVWTGMGGSEPRCDWTSASGQVIRTTPARVAWLLLKGRDVPDDQHLRRTCERERCIAPDHQNLTSDYASRPSLRRIRKDVLSDGNGGYIHARCGNALAHTPRPGRRIYCPTCYQEDQRMLKAVQSARISNLRSTYEMPPPAPVFADGSQDETELPETMPPAELRVVFDHARNIEDLKREAKKLFD